MINNQLFYDLTHTSALSRFLFFLLADTLIISLSLYLSFLVHFDFNFQVPYAELLQEILFFFVILKISFLAFFRVYKITWRYVGVADLLNIVMAVVIAEMVLLIVSLPNEVFHLPITGLAKRIFLVDGFFTLAFISTLRISKKLYMEVIREKGAVRKGKRTLIIGAGNTGDMLLRDMARNGFQSFYPMGLLDDDRMKVGTYVHGVKVLGMLEKLDAVIARYNVEVVLIAIPSLDHKTMRGLYDSAKKCKVGMIKVVPRIYDFDKPDINLKGLEDISIEDLIGRQVIKVDYQGIRDFIEGKTVLITGAGGSIGMEIVTQVCAFAPQRVVLFEIDETELHNLSLRLTRMFPLFSGEIVYVTGDVRDEERVCEIFMKYKPEIIFHAAAYKHVPMMEYNPREAAKVNIFGTLNIVRAAVTCGAETFVMISTDKAVRPTSVMGATKRMAEFICRAFGEKGAKREAIGDRQGAIGEGRATSEKKVDGGWCLVDGEKTGGTSFMSVRFGNVLGSRGSVLPLFLEQLKHGGPLTVTDPGMKRYFMTIPEAVSLVLQASTLGKGGEVFVLDMGEPVMITRIAEELIRLHGLEPYKDIDIKFTGLRPGEKLFEEILTAEEGTDASCHEKIFVARNSGQYTIAELEVILSEFSDAIRDSSVGSDENMKQLLRKYVKHYHQSVKDIVT
jgi:FlaA1/EpsC-like NDP-sugar epimerase